MRKETKEKIIKTLGRIIIVYLILVILWIELRPGGDRAIFLSFATLVGLLWIGGVFSIEIKK
jgi:hypothetical protein